MIKKIFYTILILLIGSIIYLNFFGISTSKFNQNIEKKIKENYPGINLKLNNVKILLNISKISIDIETDYPLILSGKAKIKLEKVSTTYDLKSFLKGEFVIKNLYIDSKKNQIKEIIKLIRSYKDSGQLLIVDKIIKRIGLPNKCFFDSPYCFTPKNRNPDLPMEFGHIQSQSKGGSIIDPNNVIWICRRHNMMMGDRDLIDLKKFLESIRKQF